MSQNEPRPAPARTEPKSLPARVEMGMSDVDGDDDERQHGCQEDATKRLPRHCGGYNCKTRADATLSALPQLVTSGGGTTYIEPLQTATVLACASNSQCCEGMDNMELFDTLSHRGSRSYGCTKSVGRKLSQNGMSMWMAILVC